MPRLFNGINHIIAGDAVHADGDGGEINGQRMGNAGLRSGTVRPANGNIQRSRRPVADIRRRNADAPVPFASTVAA